VSLLPFFPPLFEANGFLFFLGCDSTLLTGKSGLVFFPSGSTKEETQKKTFSSSQASGAFLFFFFLAALSWAALLFLSFFVSPFELSRN